MATELKLWKTVLGSPWFEAGKEPEDAIIEEMFKTDLGVPMGITYIVCTDASGGGTDYMYTAGNPNGVNIDTEDAFDDT